MPEDFYGFSPAYCPYCTDDYADSSGLADSYSATDWQDKPTTDVNIISMWKWVENESDEHALATAETWSRVQQLLDVTAENLRRHAEALRDKWTSEAGTVFLKQVGATLYSLDEWSKVAAGHRDAITSVASAIDTAQETLGPIYTTYENNKAANDREREENRNSLLPGVEDFFQLKSEDELQEEVHEEAVAAVKPLADAYIDAYIYKVSRGTTFKGPLQVAQINQSTMSTPSGVAPVTPTRSGLSTPSMPSRGSLSQTPTVPTTPGVPTTPASRPGTTNLPAVPTGTGVPTAPTRASAAATPSTPAVPVATSTPVAGRSAAAARASLAGTTVPSKTSSPTSLGRSGSSIRPTLPGSRSTSTSSGTSGTGSRGRTPSLPGSKGAGTSSGKKSSVPGGNPRTGTTNPLKARPSTTKSGLGGRTVPPSARPSAPGSGPTARPSLGGKQGPQKSGTAKPPSGKTPVPKKPTIAGKTELTSRGPATRPGASPAKPATTSLGGRTADQAARDAQRRQQPAAVSEPQDQEYAIGTGDGLWNGESRAVRPIDTPAEHTPQQQGRVLGNG